MAENVKSPEQESNFKVLVFPVIVLVVICLVCSALLAVLNNATAPVIAENQRAETLAAYVGVLPEGTETDDMTEVTVPDGTEGVQGAVTTTAGDAAVKAAAAGYSGKDVTVYVAFATDGTISAITIDASTQTTGIGSKVAEDSFAQQFIGMDGSAGVEVDGIAGATYSSNAVKSAVQSAVDFYNNTIKGGE
ncbi:MAG: FMN-binding protein [Gemmiger sp.]|uniref:FMN-binding protein n=1 Tax=Gemmiger sp. TaxID=2049027 RepID=UPI002E797ABF|nr:FMN-binding protein [Gemmiger sp.]MEE0801042.1 FMN-binding protein [Gemmiger sp.]